MDTDQLTEEEIALRISIMRAFDGMPYGGSAHFRYSGKTLRGARIPTLEDVLRNLESLQAVLRSAAESSQRETSELMRLRGLVRSVHELAQESSRIIAEQEAAEQEAAEHVPPGGHAGNAAITRSVRTRPSYAELATAFWELVAQTNNDGEAVAPSGDEIERAVSLLEQTGVESPYPGFPA